MKINFKYCETQTLLRTIGWMAVGILGLGNAVGNAYQCGQFTKCKQLDERGYDPKEIFSDKEEAK